jgi:hypothetical protein
MGGPPILPRRGLFVTTFIIQPKRRLSSLAAGLFDLLSRNRGFGKGRGKTFTTAETRKEPGLDD